MRDALRAGDQEQYFRILSRTELLLPVSADALAGRAPMGWGTWTTSGRTHVLAFTSSEALQACLAEHAGSARKLPYHELAAGWPNLEWWLAVNPGLPIEGYLPAWFVAQLARGDVRLPGRAASRPRDSGSARATAAVPGQPVDAAAGTYAAPPASGLAAPVPPQPQAPQPQAPQPAPVATGAGLPRRPTAAPVVPGYGAPATLAAGAAVGSPAPSAPGVPPASYPPPATDSTPSGLPRRPVVGGEPEPARAAGAPGRPDSLPRRPGLAPQRPESGPAGGQPDVSALAAPRPPMPPGPSLAAPPTPRPGGSSLASAFPSRSAERAGPGAPPLGGLARASAPTSAPPGVPGPTEQSPPGQPPAWAGPGAPAPTAPPGQAPAPPTPPAQPSPAPAWAGPGVAPPLAPPTAPQPAPPTAPPGPSFPAPAWAGPGGTPSTPPGQQPPVAPPVPPGPSPVSTLVDPSFVPANEVEEALLTAAGDGSTDSFLSTLLLAKVVLPVPADATEGALPGDDKFAWRTETIDNERYVVVFTSTERLGEYLTEPANTVSVNTVSVKFIQLIRSWPDPAWSFAVNPGTPVGATLPGAQIVALASWAADVGLGAEADLDADLDSVVAPDEAERPRRGSENAASPTLMQKVVPPSHVEYYLERGYDRVSGFVHRATEVGHLRTPARLVTALGLRQAGSAFAQDAAEVHVLRWPAYQPSLYRIPYGGQTEAAMRAMEGWVIERSPFRGNGFAPGDSSEVVAEFKVDSARLPHGAQLWRVSADGSEKLVAVLDADRPVWRRVGED
jgi:hypothetical protein